MIQRIQTIYYLIAIIALGIVSSGITIVEFLGKESYYQLNSNSIRSFSSTDELIETKNYPFYFFTVSIILVLILCIFGYKNLKRQLQLGRITLLLYFMVIVFVFFGSFLGDNLTGDIIMKSNYQIGFYPLLIGLPFVILGNWSVNKDKKLLDSLNRLR